MRPLVYVPQRIANVGTRAAVTLLCDAMSYADAEQSLCRLLGWMCQQDVVRKTRIEVD